MNLVYLRSFLKKERKFSSQRTSTVHVYTSFEEINGKIVWRLFNLSREKFGILFAAHLFLIFINASNCPTVFRRLSIFFSKITGRAKTIFNYWILSKDCFGLGWFSNGLFTSKHSIDTILYLIRTRLGELMRPEWFQ